MIPNLFHFSKIKTPPADYKNKSCELSKKVSAVSVEVLQNQPARLHQPENLKEKISIFLNISINDRMKISELLKVLDESSTIGLSFKIHHLSELGEQIQHVHPLAFLKTIFEDQELKFRFRRIFHHPFKRLGMMNGNGLHTGFAAKLDAEEEKGNIKPHIPLFAQTLKVPLKLIEPAILTRAWTDLCLILLEHTSEQPKQSHPE